MKHSLHPASVEGDGVNTRQYDGSSKRTTGNGVPAHSLVVELVANIYTARLGRSADCAHVLNVRATSRYGRPAHSFFSPCVCP